MKKHITSYFRLVMLASILWGAACQGAAMVVFEERNGLVAVEAEHFYKQTANQVREWKLTTATRQPKVAQDADGPHVIGASGGAYLELLPDTRHNHGHKLIHGENFSNQPGKVAILHYRVHFNTPGKYYVWVRAYSTGSEDNGIHVGLDGQWPASGQRMQWCEGKHSWRWESKQRTEKNHCGEPYKIFLNIDRPGEHDILFSMREDGFEFDKFLLTTNRNFKRPTDAGPGFVVKRGRAPEPFAIPPGYTEAKESRPASVAGKKTAQAKRAAAPSPAKASQLSAEPLVLPRRPDGDGEVTLSGELKQWHKVTLSLNGPYAHEQDNRPNPFRDYRMEVTFTHESGQPSYRVPGYFAADGNAADTSAQAGTIWRAHLSPDKPGKWTYRVSFVQAPDAAINPVEGRPLGKYHGRSGSFRVGPTDKTGRDLRAKGRLQYVGIRYLRFAGTGEYFLKAGADAPETFLAYVDFDGTVANKPGKAPLKTWSRHVRDWRPGDPTWKGGKGKGMIGAINYLAAKGCNVFSFIPYNAGGDGDNVWPFTSRNDKFHYDCSKLDQWGIVFDHGTRLGHYLHFKLQETENDDNRRGGHQPGNAGAGRVPTSLDGGKLGPERKLYLREIIARFGHALALNWNLGEENTQSTQEQIDMARYIRDVDPYDHLIVLHTFPNQQDKVYPPLFGDRSEVSGFSLQNSNIRDTHWQVVKWVKASAAAGKPWVTAFDESGTAQYAQVPDLGYAGFNGFDKDGKKVHTQHEVRKYTLWGTFMGGGAGCEYYFGYKLPENDLLCEDWRSRDQSWDYCRIALNFFKDHRIPFWEMDNADELVGVEPRSNLRYCFAKKGSVYLVYLPNGGTCDLDLGGVKGDFTVRWFNPRSGGELQPGSKARVSGGQAVSIGFPPADRKQDWLAVIRR